MADARVPCGRLLKAIHLGGKPLPGFLLFLLSDPAQMCKGKAFFIL